MPRGLRPCAARPSRVPPRRPPPAAPAAKPPSGTCALSTVLSAAPCAAAPEKGREEIVAVVLVEVERPKCLKNGGWGFCCKNLCFCWPNTVFLRSGRARGGAACGRPPSLSRTLSTLGSPNLFLAFFGFLNFSPSPAVAVVLVEVERPKCLKNGGWGFCCKNLCFCWPNTVFLRSGRARGGAACGRPPSLSRTLSTLGSPNLFLAFFWFLNFSPSPAVAVEQLTWRRIHPRRALA